MKRLLLLSATILCAATACAEEQSFFQINAHFEGVDRAYVTAATGVAINGQQEMELPRVIARGGQSSTLKLGWTPTPFPREAKMAEILQGITLEVKPVFSSGKITLYGKSIVRHPASIDNTGAFHTQTFTTRETYFWGEGTDDKPLTVRTGDSDKQPSWIVLTVKRIDEAEATRLTTPKFRVFAIEPTGEEAKKPIYQVHSIVPAESPENRREGTLQAVRAQGFAMASFYQPRNRMPRPLADYEEAKAMRELALADQPVKVSGAFTPEDSELLDIKLESTDKSERKFSGQVYLHWGSDIYLALADKTSPTGVRLVIIRQE